MLFNKRKKEEEQKRAEYEEIARQKQQEELRLQKEREQREREEALMEAQKPISPYKFSRPDPWPKELASVLKEMFKKLFPDARKAYLVSAEYEGKTGYLLVVDIEARYHKIINIYLDGETKRVRGDKPIECILYSKSGSLTDGMVPFYEKAENSATAMASKESEYALRSALNDIRNEYTISFDPAILADSDEEVEQNVVDEDSFVQESVEETAEETAEEIADETVEKSDEELADEPDAKEAEIASDDSDDASEEVEDEAEAVAEDDTVEEIADEAVEKSDEELADEPDAKEAEIASDDSDDVSEEVEDEAEAAAEDDTVEDIADKAIEKSDEELADEPDAKEAEIASDDSDDASEEVEDEADAVTEDDTVEETTDETVEEPDEMLLDESGIDEEDSRSEETEIFEGSNEEDEDELTEPSVVKVVPETKQQLFALMQRAGTTDNEESQSIAYAGFGEFRFYIPYESEEGFAGGEEKESFPESSRLVMLINRDNGIKAIPFFTDKDDVISFAEAKNCEFACVKYNDYKTAAHDGTIVSPAAEGIIINPGAEQILLPPDYPLL